MHPQRIAAIVVAVLFISAVDTSAEAAETVTTFSILVAGPVQVRPAAQPLSDPETQRSPSDIDPADEPPTAEPEGLQEPVDASCGTIAPACAPTCSPCCRADNCRQTCRPACRRSRLFARRCR